MGMIQSCENCALHIHKPIWTYFQYAYCIPILLKQQKNIENIRRLQNKQAKISLFPNNSYPKFLISQICIKIGSRNIIFYLFRKLSQNLPQFQENFLRKEKNMYLTTLLLCNFMRPITWDNDFLEKDLNQTCLLQNDNYKLCYYSTVCSIASDKGSYSIKTHIVSVHPNF